VRARALYLEHHLQWPGKCLQGGRKACKTWEL